MVDLALQFLGFMLLLAGLAAGWRRWIQPRASRLAPPAIGLLLLIVLIAAGGLLGSPFWWLDQRQSFAWDLPPLASRMLAAAGWSFAAACWLCLEKPSARRVRLVLLMTIVYLAPLAAAIVAFHLDRFDFHAPITYGFFIIAVGITLAVLYYLARQPVIFSSAVLDNLPAGPAQQIWLMALAALTALWGLAVFTTDSGPSPLIWVWRGDLLSSRLIAVMLLTIAVGAAYGLRRADTARVMLTVSAVYGLGLALAAAWNALDGKPVPAMYGAVFGLTGAVSAVLLVLPRQPVLHPPN